MSVAKVYCQDFCDRNKDVYNETRLYLQYVDEVENMIEKSTQYNFHLQKYFRDEIQYRNKMVNKDYHKEARRLSALILELSEDIEYMNNKIVTMKPDILTYQEYIFCENYIFSN